METATERAENFKPLEKIKTPNLSPQEADRIILHLQDNGFSLQSIRRRDFWHLPMFLKLLLWNIDDAQAVMSEMWFDYTSGEITHEEYEQRVYKFTHPEGSGRKARHTKYTRLLYMLSDKENWHKMPGYDIEESYLPPDWEKDWDEL